MTHKSVNGFRVSTFEESGVTELVGGIKINHALNECYHEYQADTTLAETGDFFQRFLLSLRYSTGGDLSLNMSQNNGVSPASAGFCDRTISLIYGDSVGQDRKIPLVMYADLLREDSTSSSANIKTETLKQLRQTKSIDLIHQWITSPTLGMEDFIISMYLMYGGSEEEINTRVRYNAKKSKFD